MSKHTIGTRTIGTRNKTLENYLEGTSKFNVVVPGQEPLSHTLILSFIVERDDIALSALFDLCEEHGHEVNRSYVRNRMADARANFQRWIGSFVGQRDVALKFLRAAKRARLWLLPIPTA